MFQIVCAVSLTFKYRKMDINVLRSCARIQPEFSVDGHSEKRQNGESKKVIRLFGDPLKRVSPFCLFD